MALSIPEHLQGKLDEAISEVIEKGPKCHWSFGGGSALECWINHRKSEDIDIFLSDLQLLPYFSPKAGAVTITDAYVESHLALKLHLPDHQIDLIVSEPLLDNPYRKHNGILIEIPSEILAKKIFHRSEQFKPRDYFDVAACFYSGVQLDDGFRKVLSEKANVLLARLDKLKALMEDGTLNNHLDIYPQYQDVANNISEAFRSGVQRVLSE